VRRLMRYTCVLEGGGGHCGLSNNRKQLPFLITLSVYSGMQFLNQLFKDVFCLVLFFLRAL